MYVYMDGDMQAHFVAAFEFHVVANVFLTMPYDSWAQYWIAAIGLIG